MKISQALKLGHKSIMGHKRRNFTTIVIIGLLFGLLAGIIFAMQGTENLLFRAADEAIGEEYYVGVMTNYHSQDCREEPIPDQPNTYNIICPENTAAESAKIVTKYGGEIISQGGSSVPIVSPGQISRFVSANLNQVPDDAVAVLVGPDIMSYISGLTSISEAPLAKRANFIRTELPKTIGTTIEDRNIDDKWYIAGILPSGTITHTYDGPGQSPNPFDMILDFLGMVRGGQSTIYLDIDSPATQEKIAFFRAQKPTLADNATFILAKFPDAGTAIKFTNREVCGMSSYNCRKPFLFNSSFDTRIGIYESSRVAWSILDIAATIIIVIAAIIMLFTFIKVLGDQTNQIRLYRSLGASTADICLIYGAYLLEVCLYAIVFMFILGLAISGLMSLLNASAFSDVLTVAYGQVFAWPKVLIGWNPSLAKFVVAMFVVAGLSLLWFILAKKYQKTI